MKKIWISVLVIFLATFSNKAQAVENAKNFYLKSGTSYLLAFDEIIKDIKYDSKLVSVESISSILSNNQQIIIKPVSRSDSKVTITTSLGLYVFNVIAESTNPVIIELDSPPKYAAKSANFDFEIDLPPKLKK